MGITAGARQLKASTQYLCIFTRLRPSQNWVVFAGSAWRDFEDVARFCRDHSHPRRSDPKKERGKRSRSRRKVWTCQPWVIMILTFTTTSTREKGENYTFNVQFMRIQVFHSVEIKVPSLPFIIVSRSFHRFISSLCVFASAASLFIYLFFTQHITPCRLTTA